MILKYVFLPLIIISLFTSTQIFAMEGEVYHFKKFYYSDKQTDSIQQISSIYWKPCISTFVELLGKGFLSLNVDYRWSKSNAISFGLQPLEVLAPDIMYYYLCGKRNRFELGGGMTVGFHHDFSVSGILIHGVVGYRNQEKKGLFFRTGVTPLYVIMFNDPKRSNKLYPFVGLSLGYSF